MKTINNQSDYIEVIGSKIQEDFKYFKN